MIEAPRSETATPGLRAPSRRHRCPSNRARRQGAGAAPSSIARRGDRHSSVAIRNILRSMPAVARASVTRQALDERPARSAASIMTCGSRRKRVCRRSPRYRQARRRPRLRWSGPTAGRSKRNPGTLRRLHRRAATNLARCAGLAQPRHAPTARHCPRCPRPPPRARRSRPRPGRCRTARRAEHLRPLAMSATAVASGAARHVSLRRRNLGATSRMPTIRKPSCSRMRPMPRRRMIVAAAKRASATGARIVPSQPDFRQRRAQRRTDEDQVAAALAAEQFGRPRPLPDRDPVMTEAPDTIWITGAAWREQCQCDPRRLQHPHHCERHRTAPR